MRISDWSSDVCSSDLHTGPTLSPFNAWVMLKGLETLDLRVERHCANALAVAQHLEREADVARVLYPGLPSHPQADLVKRQMQGGSTLVAFEVRSAERRVGKGWVSTCRSRWGHDH